MTVAPAAGFDQTRKAKGMATVWGKHFFALGPLLALGVVAGLALFLRWAFPGRNTSLVQRVARPGKPDDYGLLAPIGEPASAIEASIWQHALTDAGIRSTLAQTTEGVRLMVRRDDVTKAESALARMRGRSQP